MTGKLASVLLESLTLEELKELVRIKEGKSEPKPMTEREKRKEHYKSCLKKKMYKVL